MIVLNNLRISWLTFNRLLVLIVSEFVNQFYELSMYHLIYPWIASRRLYQSSSDKKHVLELLRLTEQKKLSSLILLLLFKKIPTKISKSDIKEFLLKKNILIENTYKMICFFLRRTDKIIDDLTILLLLY